MQILGNPGVGAACAGGTAAAGVARDPWAANLPEPIPMSEPRMLVPAPRSLGTPVGPNPRHPRQVKSPSSLALICAVTLGKSVRFWGFHYLCGKGFPMGQHREGQQQPFHREARPQKWEVTGKSHPSGRLQSRTQPCSEAITCTYLCPLPEYVGPGLLAREHRMCIPLYRRWPEAPPTPTPHRDLLPTPLQDMLFLPLENIHSHS